MGEIMKRALLLSCLLLAGCAAEMNRPTNVDPRAASADPEEWCRGLVATVNNDNPPWLREYSFQECLRIQKTSAAGQEYVAPRLRAIEETVARCKSEQPPERQSSCIL